MLARGLTVLAAAALVIAAETTPTAQSFSAQTTAASRAAFARSLHGLAPGKFVVYQQKVPIEIVLIGFNNAQVNGRDLLGALPDTYLPLVRYPQFYGLNGRDLGLNYDFKYSLSRRSRAFEEQFFNYLSRAGSPGPPTLYQQGYNGQVNRVLDITGPVLYIDAPKVEHWLAEHDGDHDKGYKIYFINWFGRRDFKFHVYTKTNDPDPDTTFNFGEEPEGAINSWGGTESRTWFYDFSAGPEWNTANWVVDATDLDGDGTDEYRMPPIWEYAVPGYRAPTELGKDMGKLTRYVAIDLLFTTSPLYDPLVTAPGPGGRKIANMTMFEDDPSSTGTDSLNAAFARQAWRRFQPYYRWATNLEDVSPADAGAKNALEIFSLNDVTAGCWQSFGDPFAQLFCYFAENLGLYVPEFKEKDYVAPVFSFNTTLDGLGAHLGLLGFADDNWVDGTQSFVFTFGTELYRQLGYGFTATTVHEVGHHIGMSHPHDGYDAESGLDYGADGPTFFAWSGDESETVMHYMSLSNQFGEHNKDNMYRWETAGYLNWSNALLADILASGDAVHAWPAIRTADLLATLAQAEFKQWNYLASATAARAAYVALVEAADEIGASSARLSSARRPLPEAMVRTYVCRPRRLQEKLAAVR